jgi:hypothetical protein
MPELEFLQLMADPKLAPIEELRPGVPPAVARVLRLGLEPQPDRRDIACAEIRDVLLAAVNAEKARENLAALLHEVGAPQKTALLEQAEATERQFTDGTNPTHQDPAGPDPTSGVRLRKSEFRPTLPTVPEHATPAKLPDAPRPILSSAIHVPTAPSAFRVAQQSLRSTWGLPLRRPSRRTTLAALLAGSALVLGVLLVTSHATKPVHAAVRAATASTTTPAPPAVRAGSSASGPPPAANASASTHGSLVTSTGSHEHRIYLDGQVVGESGEPIDVRCGRHLARYGSRGRPQTVDVPCGGTYVLSPRW